MLTIGIVIIIGLIGGISVGIQAPVVGAMGQRVGGTASSVIVHFSGFVLSMILLAIRGGERIRESTSLPWYMWGAGVFGLILYQSINITLPRLGAASMLTLIIVGQLITGVCLDTFGWLGIAARPINPTRIIGIIVLLGGGYLIVK